MESYIEYLRKMVGKNKVILNGSCVVITNKLNQVLLQKRVDDNGWGLPGGLLEFDETLEECAIREVKEETNLDIEIKKFIGVFLEKDFTWENKDVADVIGFGFYGEVIGGRLTINDNESLDLKYFDYHNLPNIKSSANLNTIIAYFENNLNTIEGRNYNGNE
ncbi:NUDIX domain-containing protein [Candidatus Izemoplasma sp. B36]|uniref:NUDIX domain-containing protein n=1 Tax=Candidatus Izemoplasma sp. B36 TaxID=3242468 RepID=UPI0035577C19